MDTRNQILNVTAELLQEHSLHGFSLQHVADRVGIRKASLFHHYRNKDALVADVIDLSIEAFRRRIAELEDQPALRQLEVLCRIYLQNIGAGKRLCTVGGVVGDWDSLDPLLRERAARLVRVQLEWLEHIARSGGLAADQQQAEAWAEQVLGALQGALTLSRLGASPAPMERAIARLLHT